MSIQNDQTKCPECGGTATIARVGHLERIKCDVCGWNQDSTVYPEDAVCLIDEHPEVVDVCIEWTNQKATSKEAMIARRAFKSLSKKPVHELLEEAKEAATYSLGMQPLPMAIELQERAKANGLSVSFSSPVEGRNGGQRQP